MATDNWHKTHNMHKAGTVYKVEEAKKRTNKKPNCNIAALGAKTKNNKIHDSPDPGRDRPKTSDLLKEMTVRTLPRAPRGEGTGQKQN